MTAGSTLVAMAILCNWAAEAQVKPPPPLVPLPATNTSGDFTETFTGTELGRSWMMVNPDPNHWVMQPSRKSLLLTSQKTPCPSEKEGKNLLRLEKPLPSGDFEIIVRASVLLQTAGHDFVIALWTSDSDYLSLGAYHSGSYQIAAFSKTFQGQTGTPLSSNVTPINDALFRMERSGNTFTASIAKIDPSNAVDPAQARWTTLGTLPWIRFQGKLAMCVYNYQDAPETSVEISSVSVRSK
jgi:hypothetical protein